MKWLHARWLMMTVMLLSVTPYLWAQFDKGWIPHDEGLLGQSATRVLAGELPHVDFDDPYTGGQAILHAAAMQVMGVDSVSLRWLLLGFTVAFAVVTFLIAQRLVSSWGAVIVAWLAVAWSVPNYFAPLPSWYNLFFAFFGIYALIRFDETQLRRWLVLAGVMGGLSFLIKIAGLYYIAAGILFLVYRDQSRHEQNGSQSLNPDTRMEDRVNEAAESATSTDPIKIRTPGFTAFVTICLACFCLLLIMLVRSRITLMDTIHFVIPGVSLAGFLIINQWRRGPQPTSDPQLGTQTSMNRVKELTVPVLTFLVGAGVPILIFLIPYAYQSGITAWIDGVFVAPQKRMQFAAYQMPPTSSLVAVIPYSALLVLPMVLRGRFNSIWIAGVAGIASTFGLLLATQEPIYLFVWNGARPLVPLMTTVGVFLLFRSSSTSTPSTSPPVASDQNRILFLLLAMTAMVSLVQFPYSFGIYFCYAIPVGVLALTAIVMRQESPPLALHLVIAGFFLGFAVIWLNHGRVQRIGVRHVPDDQETVLELPRAGLRVSAGQSRLYTRVVSAVQKYSKKGSSIYATADCPEIYFLADRKNPTRSFYDFFEPDFAGEPSLRVKRIKQLLDENEIEVVVLHWNGEFSGRVPMDFAEMVATNFPNVEHFVRQTKMGVQADPAFSVAWRELARKDLNRSDLTQ